MNERASDASLPNIPGYYHIELFKSSSMMHVFFALFVLGVALSVVWLVHLNSSSTPPIVVVALNYQTRPSIIPSPNHVFQPVEAPSVWNGSFLSRNPHLWIYNLTVEDQHSLRAAVAHFQSSNKSLGKMTLNDFPLSKYLQTHIVEWKTQLSGLGRGFQVLRGVPVQNMTRAEIEIAFYGLGKHVGNPGAQDVQGALLKQVIDVGPTNQTERPYRTRAAITYHCDGADIVALLCLHPAKEGGASRIISTASVYNQLLQHPNGQQYARRLFDKVLLFTDKSFATSPYVSMGYLWYSLWRKVVPFRLDSAGVLRSYWNQELGFVRSYRDTKSGNATPAGIADRLALEATEAYEAILNKDVLDSRKETTENELGLSMHLQQGDIQWVSNHFVLHGRTAFADYTPEEITAASASSSSHDAGTSTHSSRDHVPVVPVIPTPFGKSNHNDLLAPIGQRELLRLWLTHSDRDLTWSEYWTKQRARAELLVTVLRDVFSY